MLGPCRFFFFFTASIRQSVRRPLFYVWFQQAACSLVKARMCTQDVGYCSRFAAPMLSAQLDLFAPLSLFMNGTPVIVYLRLVPLRQRRIYEFHRVAIAGPARSVRVGLLAAAVFHDGKSQQSGVQSGNVFLPGSRFRSLLLAERKSNIAPSLCSSRNRYLIKILRTWTAGA